MARFVDLDDEEDSHAGPQPELVLIQKLDAVLSGQGAGKKPMAAVPQIKRTNTAMTRVFLAYPVVEVLTQHLDLNDMDSLSRSCRMVHDALLQFRPYIIANSIRCINTQGSAPRHGVTTMTSHLKNIPCARDMVAPCRRCGIVVCRNCVLKGTPNSSLKDRHRRLCNSCTIVPISHVLNPRLSVNIIPTKSLVQHEICTCESRAPWLCKPCGRIISTADNDYKRVWKWRNTYGEVLGGLGTGIGDGDRGTICGRDKMCCAATDRENELDCDAEDARFNPHAPMPWNNDSNGSAYKVWSSTTAAMLHSQRAVAPSLGGTTPPGSSGPSHGAQASGNHVASPGTQSPNVQSSHIGFPVSNYTSTNAGSSIHQPFDINTWTPPSSFPPTPGPSGPGYSRHEIEGIGGVVKRKVVRMVRVGACVPEWEEDKAESTRWRKEKTGERRSWCGWCLRVIPSSKELERLLQSDGEFVWVDEGLVPDSKARVSSKQALAYRSV